MDSFREFLINNPHYFGLLFVLIGSTTLLASIYDAEWLFGNVSSNTYNLKKIDGLVNRFGRKRARIIYGIFSVSVIISGLVWFTIYKFYYL
ncbi:MAG: immunity 17 family protein [Rikenellaceae bacterium]|nr:immunity 17 family protein [Rikenellaceae bacterium]